VELPRDLDPALPGLAEALDPAGAVRRFERTWPGPDRPASITACDLKHVRWAPGVECVATFQLTLKPSLASGRSTMGIVVASPEGIRHRLFDSDPDLPGLSSATDPQPMRRWLAERLGRHVDSCSTTPVTYRAGRRCVLRYELADGNSTVLYGKVLAGDRSRELAETITGLGDSLVPRLTGVAPEWQLVVQADAGGRSLRAAASSPDAEAFAEVRAAGVLLARLHSRSGPRASRRSLLEDAELREYLPALQRVSPASAALFAAGIDCLPAGADTQGATAPGHGAFRLNQVHATSGGPVFLDLDSYCWADPARDVGNLLAYLRWQGIRQPNSTPAIADVRTTFLAGYVSAAIAPLDDDRLRIFEGASLLKIAGRRYRSLAVREWNLVPELIDAALACLGAGRTTSRAGR
jgi:Phosphotransferase enzyme family